jgi:hypothetical protein
MTDRLHALGQATCEARGYEVTTPGKPWLPTSLAEPTVDASPFVSRATNARVAIEPLGSDEVRPTTLLSRLRNNAGHDRFSLFVVGSEADARVVHRVLHRPPLVAAEDDHGRRTFYNGPDRIPLAEGGYAATRTDTAPADLVWRESGVGDDRSLVLVDPGSAAGLVDASPEDTAGEPSSGEADTSEQTGTVLACFDDVDGVACPESESFPYSYYRDPDDKRFRVQTRDGRSVGVYDGVADMRSNAYVPIPMPLVPEHLFSGIPSVRDEWAVLLVDADADDPVAASATRVVTAGSVGE